jgi:hypothetical protein
MLLLLLMLLAVIIVCCMSCCSKFDKGIIERGVLGSLLFNMSLLTANKAYVCDVTAPVCLQLSRLIPEHRLDFAPT